jgi:hypothetical protein
MGLSYMEMRDLCTLHLGEALTNHITYAQPHHFFDHLRAFLNFFENADNLRYIVLTKIGIRGINKKLMVRQGT